MFAAIISLLIFFCPAPVQAQDLFPQELLPTVEVNPEHLLKGGEYQLELSPLEEETPQKAMVKTKDTLSPQQRLEFEKEGFLLHQKKGELSLTLSAARIGLGDIAGSSSHGGNVEIRMAADNPSYIALMAKHSPTESAANTFSPTICDGGADTCTALHASRWNRESSFGFGFNLSGEKAPADFINADYFRPLRQEFPVVISKNEYLKGVRTLNMTIKLQTPPSTEEGVYSTNVDIVALNK